MYEREGTSVARRHTPDKARLSSSDGEKALESNAETCTGTRFASVYRETPAYTAIQEGAQGGSEGRNG